MIKRIWAVAFVILATACVGMAPPKADVDETPQFLSLPPDSLGRSLSLSQLVTGEYGDKIYRMRYEVEITPARLVMVGLSPLGVTLFTLVQEQDETLKVMQLDHEKEQATFDPRHVLFDLYLTYWPREVLQTALSSLSMRLDENTDGSVRRITRLSGEAIAEIAYPPKNLKGGETVIQHFDFPYRLRIVNLETKGM